MAAIRQLEIEKGATYQRVWTLTDSAGNLYNLTGYTAAMEVRDDYDGTVLLTLTTANGRLALGGALGTITAEVSATITAAIDWSDGVYDLEITHTACGYVKRVLQGTITVSDNVTEI